MRLAHGGQVDDARLRWAGALRCGTCAQPFCASGLRQHYRRDPATGERRCPVAFRAAPTCATITPADAAFVRGLSADEVYVQSVPTIVELGTDCGPEVGAVLAPLAVTPPGGDVTGIGAAAIARQGRRRCANARAARARARRRAALLGTPLPAP